MNRIVPGWDDRITGSDVAQPRMYLRVALLEHPDLRDAVLVRHSMGTGEVTRCLASYGSGDHHALQLGHHRPRVAEGVPVSPIPPYLLQTPDNPDGVPGSVFDGFAPPRRRTPRPG
jgi:pimeloyl-ACP methyl ester carboxylesterase